MVDERIVLTLDAGGTNFVFNAVKAGEEVCTPYALPAYPDDLERCLNQIINGFRHIKKTLKGKPSAISFAFPGPADYKRGIITNPPNLSAFQGGVALGPMLENEFGIPVFINNDGDLFAYGEAQSGFLPDINRRLMEAGSGKQYHNLIGITLGTGFGCGITCNGQMIEGDNGGAGETWLLRHKIKRRTHVEEDISIRGILRLYKDLGGTEEEQPLTPKDLYDIARGKRAGDQEAARRTFSQFGEILGDAVATIVALIDGLVVVGGGLSGSHELIFPAMIAEMNAEFETSEKKRFKRLSSTVFNLENKADMTTFLKGSMKQVAIPGTHAQTRFDAMPRTGVGLSRLGTSRAISIGAYRYALEQL